MDCFDGFYLWLCNFLYFFCFYVFLLRKNTKTFIKSQYIICSVRSMGKRDLVIAGATLTLIAYTIVISFAGQALSALQTSRTVSNAGEIKTIGVGIYLDSSCSNCLSSINWGTLDPGTEKTFTYYVRNDGNSPSTLTLQTSNWSPPGAATYILLSWDYDGQTLNIDEVIQVTFTLSISPTIEGITSFNFDITVIGTST